jgi:hypothetical protein
LRSSRLWATARPADHSPASVRSFDLHQWIARFGISDSQ